MKMKFISQSKSFYGFCLIKVYYYLRSVLVDRLCTQWSLQTTKSLACSQTLYFPGGYSWEFLVGVCRPVRQFLNLFQSKNYNFPHSFSDQTSKIYTCFQTWSSFLESPDN